MKTMNKKAIAYAIRHKIRLGLDHATGLYYIPSEGAPAGWPTFDFRGTRIWDLSLRPTGQSAIVMMKRLVRSVKNQSV